jgi:hypothetical protein
VLVLSAVFDLTHLDLGSLMETVCLKKAAIIEASTKLLCPVILRDTLRAVILFMVEKITFSFTSCKRLIVAKIHYINPCIPNSNILLNGIWIRVQNSRLFCCSDSSRITNVNTRSLELNLSSGSSEPSPCPDPAPEDQH